MGLSFKKQHGSNEKNKVLGSSLCEFKSGYVGNHSAWFQML